MQEGIGEALHIGVDEALARAAEKRFAEARALAEEEMQERKDLLVETKAARVAVREDLIRRAMWLKEQAGDPDHPPVSVVCIFPSGLSCTFCCRILTVPLSFAG